jgi:FtsP/CotA-like multicopper oxidase with cupredoxin domain
LCVFRAASPAISGWRTTSVISANALATILDNQKNQAATLWYHPHLHETTQENNQQRC